uniref:Thymosin beta n=1 Tax=Oncorhynchus tshawytscha TaxID=74940 RepID=A0AAZ3RMH2_ONCTS
MFHSKASLSPLTAIMSDKPNMREISSFDKTKLKKTETRVKNPLPTKETIDEERKREQSH